MKQEKELGGAWMAVEAFPAVKDNPAYVMITIDTEYRGRYTDTLKIEDAEAFLDMLDAACKEARGDGPDVSIRAGKQSTARRKG